MIDSAAAAYAVHSPSCCKLGLFALLMIAGSLFAGCNGGDGNTTTVEGKVTYNGNAVTNGLINFQARGERPLGGPIGSDGTYSFDLPPGEYQVRVDTPPQFPEGYKEGDILTKQPPRQVPEKYASYNSSGLTATVEADGPQTIDFNLP